MGKKKGNRWFGDFEDAWNKGDVAGVLTLGTSRGAGRQYGAIAKGLNETFQPVIDGLTGKTAKEAAELAAAAQLEASDKELGATELAIDEQRRQFDAITELFAPYVSAGNTALSEQMNLMGLGEPGSQEAAIQGIEQGPEFQALMNQGEEALLQNASATGGLRGGNTQNALANFRPDLLNSLIEKKMQGLAGLSGRGQSAAGFQGSAGQNTASNISNIFGQQGNIYGNIGGINSGLELAKGNADMMLSNNLMKLGGMFVGGGGLNFLSGDGSGQQSSSQGGEF